jgi:hypothetical protein
MKKLFSIAIVLVFVLAVFVPVSAASSNECPDGWLVKLEADGTVEPADYVFPSGFTWEIVGKTVTFSQPVSFCVKGGSLENSGNQTGTYYEVDFLNNAGNNPDISHVVIYAFLDFGQWCSPGYWRQPQHLDSWEATGINPDDLFSDIFFYTPSRSKLGVTNGATPTPTLWDVLQAPQYYGGDAFNKVGDLLSSAHPDVNFLGTRVEDSCPLN